MNGFSARGLVPALLAVLAACLASVPAHVARAQGSSQQITSVTPYFAVVNADNVVLRSGGNELMYPIMPLARGTVLRVDGESRDVVGQTWSRVSYPHGSFVFLPTDAVQLESGGGTGTLTKLARVKAPNMNTGISGSWSDATPQALGVGTRVTLISPEVVRGSSWEGYRVTPPESARAWVVGSALRRATQDEINQFMARAAAAGTAVPATPAPALTPAPTPAAEPPAATPTQPTPATTAPPTTTPPTTTTPAASPAAAPAGGNLAEPMVIPQGGQTPRQTPAPAPATPRPTPAEPQPVETPAPPATPQSRFERLEAALAAIRQQPIETAEYAELLAQYESEIANLEDTPANRPLRQRLEQRQAFLKILTDMQAQRRRLQADAQAATAAQGSVGERLAEVARARQYTIVGRLTTSTLFDGTRLPRMFRVQAIGGSMTRTLAYIRPEASPGLDRKVGQIVGVIGTQAIDPSLQLNIITPTRVDVLEAAPAPAATGGRGGS